jgi:hypothetical protein
MATNVPGVILNPVIWLTRHSQELDRGDILIQGLWQLDTDCILDVWVMTVDAKSNCSKIPDKVLEWHQKEKKWKYLQACMNQCYHFTPFIVFYGKKIVMKKVSGLLAEKWSWLYSVICGYIKARRMSIDAVRATHLHMHERLPDPYQPDQHSPSPVGGQGGSWSISALVGLTTKNECTLKHTILHTTAQQTVCTLHHNVRYQWYLWHLAMQVFIQFSLPCRS